MNKKLRIVGVEQEDEFGVIVTFSDGTTAGYVIEELLTLRPKRKALSPKPKPTPKKKTREDVNQAAARIIREATERD